MKEEWRSAMTTSGGQSVMIPGPTLMPVLSAGNLDTHQLVSNKEMTFMLECICLISLITIHIF